MANREIKMKLGKNLGQCLMQIGVEKLYAYDMQGALKVFTDCFPGMDDGTAFRLLTGSRVLETSENKIDMVVREREWDCDTQPYFDVDYFIKNHYDMFFRKHGYLTYEEEYRAWLSLNSKSEFCVTIDSAELFRMLTDENRCEYFDNMQVTVTAAYLIEIIEKHDTEWTRKLADLCNDESLQQFLLTYVDFAQTMRKIKGFTSVIGFISDSGYELSPSQKSQIEMISDTLTKLESAYDDFKCTAKTKELARKCAQILRDNTLTHEYVSDIMPVGLNCEYDAYWVSQDGTAYGCNGGYGEFLHLQMSDAICRKKNYEVRNGEDSSRTLERLGYVKIHHRWVLYDGYDMPKLAGREIPVSDSQMRFLEKYAEKYSEGKLAFGYGKELRTVAGMTDEDYEKLLSL